MRKKLCEAFSEDVYCSQERSNSGRSINADAATDVVKKLAERFELDSMMTFGGEPMLFADSVCKIHAAARDYGIPKRQLIRLVRKLY